MAITTEQGILAMLKVYYAKEGLQNLLFRNDPFLKMVKKNRVEGKQQNFSAMYSRGGAVSANYVTAKNIAKTTSAQAKEFQVVPGQLFSACVFNNAELLASKTQRGAYLPVASAKMFANAESFRKTLAVAVYGSGHGEIYTATAAMGFTVAEKAYTLPTSAIMGIDIGSKIDVFAVDSGAVDYSTVKCTLTVTAIDMASKSVKATSDKAYAGAIGDVLAIAGCSAADGTPLLPVGIAGWLPVTAPAANDNFFGVNRSVAPDRLAGNRISGTGKTKIEAIKEAILQVARYGSKADMIVMNDADRLALANEIENKTYFTKVDGGKGKTKAEVGYSDIGFSVDKNFLDNVIGSPYCPEGVAYILDSEAVELWTYSNADKINDGATDPYKPEVDGENGVQDKPYQLLVDDLFSIQPGEETASGPAALVSINFYGEFVVTNPSMCAVIKF